MQKKMAIIQQNEQLKADIPDVSFMTANDGLLCRSSKYAAIGCDLRNLDFLRFVLAQQLSAESCSVAILFVAEVSIAYMDLEGSQAVMEWAAAYNDVRFCLLEQHLPDGPDHPFALTMLKHFEKLRTPLRQVGTMGQMRERFQKARWPASGIAIKSLWQMWSDETFLTADQRKSLDLVEPFDEWEEFALFASHYFLLVAKKDNTSSQVGGTCEDDDRATLGDILGAIGDPIACDPQPAISSQRRFAAVIPPRAATLQIGLHGGLGTKERLSSTDVISPAPGEAMVDGPPLLAGIMCHTITPFEGVGDCLMVGGRTSPDKAISDCWLREDGGWQRVQSLPFGRYRHCASAVRDQHRTAVLIFGGKDDTGRPLSDFMLWRKSSGWTTITTRGAVMPASFSSTVVVDSDTGLEGHIMGGLSESGTIHERAWSWRLDSKDIMTIEEVTAQTTAQLGPLSKVAWRFGAQTTHWSPDGTASRTLMVGGIGSQRMLDRQTEVLDLTIRCIHPIQGPRPLFVGHSLYRQLCVGGGATCFSFGTFWNSAIRFCQSESPPVQAWRTLWPGVSPKSTNKLNGQQRCEMSQPTAIPSLKLSELDFDKMLQQRRPFRIMSCDLGSCVKKWSPEYLKTTIKDRKVVVHASASKNMDFQTKNFEYQTQDFSSFLDAIEQGQLFYMRALSSRAPAEQPTDLATDFPEVASDFVLPPQLQYVADNAHSSPLRISGPTIMWLHYDVMSNVLCQIRGRKRLLLFPPSDLTRLGFEAGSSSSSLNVFSEDTAQIMQDCHPSEVTLEPGDVLYIPSLWLHAAEPIDTISIAVNVFFKDLQQGYAAGRDVYGNRDLAAYERGRKDLARIRHAFAGFPREVSRFYLQRLAAELLEGA